MSSLLIAKERLQDRIGEHAVVGDLLEAVERLLTASVLNKGAITQPRSQPAFDDAAIRAVTEARGEAP